MNFFSFRSSKFKIVLPKWYRNSKQLLIHCFFSSYTSLTLIHHHSLLYKFNNWKQKRSLNIIRCREYFEQPYRVFYFLSNYAPMTMLYFNPVVHPIICSHVAACTVLLIYLLLIIFVTIILKKISTAFPFYLWFFFFWIFMFDL